MSRQRKKEKILRSESCAQIAGVIQNDTVEVVPNNRVLCF